MIKTLNQELWDVGVMYLRSVASPAGGLGREVVRMMWEGLSR